MVSFGFGSALMPNMTEFWVVINVLHPHTARCTVCEAVVSGIDCGDVWLICMRSHNPLEVSRWLFAFKNVA